MKKYILLADDSPDDEICFKRILKAAGVENSILVARDGEEVICWLKGEGIYADRQRFPMPSILFLDLLMPRADGWEVLRWISANLERDQLLVIVLAGAAQIRQLEQAYELGANSFLFKPFTKAELTGLIQYWPEFWTLSKPPAPPGSSA